MEAIQQLPSTITLEEYNSVTPSSYSNLPNVCHLTMEDVKVRSTNELLSLVPFGDNEDIDLIVTSE